MYNVFNVNLFNLLEQDVFHFNQLGSVFLAGDFNARVGQRLDYIDFDRNVDGLNFSDVSIDKPTSRASMDNICNTRGNLLLDLCKSTSLSIGNGRLGSDKSTGTYTYFTKHACSTIDYLLLSKDDFQLINEFSVGRFDMYIDHAPLLFSIQFPFTPADKNKHNEKSIYFKWTDEKRDLFRRNVISELSRLNDCLYNVEKGNRNNIEEMVSNFSNSISKAADPLFKCTTFKGHTEYDLNKQWFNSDCIKARRVYQCALNSFNANKSVENRELLCQKRSIYKKLVRSKKHSFKLKQSKEFENLKKKQPRDVWNFFKRKTCKM